MSSTRKSSRKSLIHLHPRTQKGSEAQRRVLDALSLKRRQPNLSMSEVARRVGTTVPTIRKYGGSGIEERSGRLDAKPTDAIRRSIKMLTNGGYEDVAVTSRDASRIARHHNAVRKYVIFDDDSALRRFENKTVR